jgi:hypothetical protein
MRLINQHSDLIRGLAMAMLSELEQLNAEIRR